MAGVMGVVISTAVVVAAPPPAREPASSDATLVRLIDELGTASYEVRTAATNRLLSMGPRAITVLKAAAHSDDFEAALRARHLLRVFDELLFTGVGVEIDVSRSRIGWSDPIALVVRLHNPTRFASRIPFAAPTSQPSGDEGSAYVRQVAAMLDVADYLEVVGPDGEPVTLHVDDITPDERVREAVDARAERAPTSELPAGGSAVYRIADFNRGWARYRLLRAGAYAIQLVYQPQWNDAELIRAGVGRVESNVVRVTVTDPAPRNVVGATAPASLVLERSGEQIVAYLTNLLDVAVHVNLNLATGEPPPFARLRWYRTCGGQHSEIALPDVPGAAGTPFRRDRLVSVQPGDRIEIGRLATAALPTADGATGTCDISATYVNVADAAWQRRELAGHVGRAQPPETLRIALPRRLLSTTLNSPPLGISEAR